ncbi:MAG: MoxR family ATPase [Acidimicrobiales bacterium]|nr:MoxR family ATPase [Acidimicrobiales bacterium]
MSYRFEDVASVRTMLADAKYLADEGIAGIVYLADRLGKPILVEGPAGTGKTELAKCVAEVTGARLIRLQCYEGLDESKALYEWNYKKQLLRIQTEEESDWSEIEDDLFSEEFLLARPLLEAIRAEDPVVLLVDEVDRIEIETEALLLEILSEYQVSIPELGTVVATQVPLVFLTSNATRELSEALKRRCLYHWVAHPSVEREVEILRLRAPLVPLALARDVALVAAELRDMGLYKPPGVAETLDWAEALVLIGADDLDPEAIEFTVGTLLKYREDQERARARGFGDILSTVLGA